MHTGIGTRRTKAAFKIMIPIFLIFSKIMVNFLIYGYMTKTSLSIERGKEGNEIESKGK